MVTSRHACKRRVEIADRAERHAEIPLGSKHLLGSACAGEVHEALQQAPASVERRRQD